MNNTIWIDTRLSEEEMNFLNDAISDVKGVRETVIDKDNWFFKSVLKKLTERLFYRNWINFSRYHIEVEEGVPLPEFEMYSFWVNHMKQHEFNPLHDHSGLYSFVIFMKIPTHWKEQHELPWLKDVPEPQASDFQFVGTWKDNESCVITNIPLSPEDEGRMLFFPGDLQHQVYPFYGTEEKRITISGNIRLYDIGAYEEKKNMLKTLEDNVKTIKGQLKEIEKGQKEKL